jgi:excisionase family DNA binding protein
MDKLLLRPPEVAEVLGIGRSRVYELLAQGALPLVRVGRSIRVPTVELRRWVEDEIRKCRPGSSPTEEGIDADNPGTPQKPGRHARSRDQLCEDLHKTV